MRSPRFAYSNATLYAAGVDAPRVYNKEGICSSSGAGAFFRYAAGLARYKRDCCIKANRGVAFGIRLRSHTEVCELQTSSSAPCASSVLQSQDNLASKIVRLFTFAAVTII